MSLNPSSPVTGSAVTGLTSPTYTFVEDVAPAVNKRRFVVTALGGTQTNVEVHSISSPFYVDISRPLSLKTLPRANALTGQYNSIPVNEFRLQFYKGCTINGSVAGASAEVVAVLEMKLRVPTGVELATNDPEEIKALLSFAGGILNANASGMYDLVTTGLLK